MFLLLFAHLSFSFSVRLSSLRRGARYPLFDKSTSISSLREHQLQDSSRDINLLSGRNVISRAIDTLVARASNTKTIAGSLFVNKQKKGEKSVQAAFGSNTKVRMTSHEARNLLSRIEGVPESTVRFFPTNAQRVRRQFYFPIHSSIPDFFHLRNCRDAKFQTGDQTSSISTKLKVDSLLERGTAETKRIISSAIIKKEISYHKWKVLGEELLSILAIRYDWLLTNSIAIFARSRDTRVSKGILSRPGAACRSESALCTRTRKTNEQTHTHVHTHARSRKDARPRRKAQLSRPAGARDAPTFADACQNAVHYLQRVVARRAICNGCFMPH